MTPSFDAGLLWVENRIRQLSQELDRPVDCLQWPRSIDASAKEIPLKLWRCGEFRTIEFRPKELLEVEGDRGVQRGMGGRMRNGLIVRQQHL